MNILCIGGPANGHWHEGWRGEQSFEIKTPRNVELSALGDGPLPMTATIAADYYVRSLYVAHYITVAGGDRFAYACPACMSSGDALAQLFGERIGQRGPGA